MHDGHRKRMISKLLSNKNSLSDHEILEILLYYAIPRKNTNETAHKILDSFGDLKTALEADVDALTAVDGVGPNVAAYLQVLGEAFSRVQSQKAALPTIYSFDSCKNLLISAFRGYSEEKFLALFLDKSGTIVLRRIFSSHSDKQVNLNVCDLIKGTVIRKPHSVVVCHNHLSDNPAPSYSDDRATEKLYIALKLHGIVFYDHVIVANDKTFSYKVSGRLDKIASAVDPMLF